MSESSLLRKVMLSLTDAGCRLFRNNVGAWQHKDGHWIKYGVCNPGGSDAIGWTSMVITSEMVGRRVAVFTAIETKDTGETATDEQENFLAAVLEAGGISILSYTVADTLADFVKWKRWIDPEVK